jgi:ribosomal-protein-alanine N-acetyltransferase
MTAGVTIHPLSSLSGDAHARMARLGALYEACFCEPYGEPAVATLLMAPGSRALISRARVNELAQDVGFVIFRHAADEAEILSIGVVPGARRRGAGRALLAAAVEGAAAAGAAAIFLEVGEDNSAARVLYETAGFVPVGRRLNYYRRADRSRVAAIVMRKLPRRT